MDRVTFTTSSGIVWLALGVHFAAGLVAIVAGTIALSVGKGGRLHKQSGLVFTWAMVVLGLTAAGIGTYEFNPSQVFAGLLAACDTVPPGEPYPPNYPGDAYPPSPYPPDQGYPAPAPYPPDPYPQGPGYPAPAPYPPAPYPSGPDLTCQLY